MLIPNTVDIFYKIPPVLADTRIIVDIVDVAIKVKGTLADHVQ